MSNEKQTTFDKVLDLCTRRGFVASWSEIYWWVRWIYDFLQLWSEMKRNIKDLFWKNMVRERKNVYGIEGAIITPEEVWKASWHLENFADPMTEDKTTHHRFRLDTLIEDQLKIPTWDMSFEDMAKMITDWKIKSPDGWELTEPKKFNLMVWVTLWITEENQKMYYLRWEACQSIYLDYKEILRSSRTKIPFGICQIGKAFRNEVTPKNFLFRQREFEQWDLQFFVHPSEMEKWYEYWKQERMNWYKSLLNNPENLRFRKHEDSELVFYAKMAYDIEYNTDFWWWKELEWIHWRSDWDLSNHMKHSKQDLSYFDPENNTKFIPWIVETSGWADRFFLFALLDAYTEEKEIDEEWNEKIRIVLKLNKKIAPVKIWLLPIVKKAEFIDKTDEIFKILASDWNTDIDVTWSIGKRYARQDEIGTPYCITVDWDTLEKWTVTVRDRDTMAQEIVKIEDLKDYFEKKFES